MQLSVRPAAVAGLFYPGNPVELEQMVDQLLDSSPEPGELPRCPKAFVVPHAGLVYSGSTAALAYRQIERWQSEAEWDQVVILGPNHRKPLRGMAGVEEEAWNTPMGTCKTALALEQRLQTHFDLPTRPDVHQLEHCIEVQLPFLKRVLPDAELLPILVGQATVEEVANLIQEVWQQPHVLLIISSDLSHYHPWSEAQTLDAATTGMICSRIPELESQQACGFHALNGLLYAARAQGLSVDCLGQTTSGDTAGSKESVVGYGAYVCY
ncbi:AmmeMemoRadiSam system protein B [Marinobacterium sp. AK62]|uniref:MEMO1 family protein H9C73_09855 n=1 Tax=Marinobacterium alkalitolerans TaxID=1542925 RepID=A0ABS3ZBK7_9GAMM|nr:AmmeMemoRadiSam system protein B [Marinobacterium alkalitolerans]MBP0049044.1 AmmeMemoRadiSam system protein B [Marinobacterium alkalitolerans]